MSKRNIKAYSKKFMQVLSSKTVKQLAVLADKKQITIQEYIRAIVIPEHLESHNINTPLQRSISHSKARLRAKKSWETRRKKAFEKRLLKLPSPTQYPDTPPETQRQKEMLTTD